MRENKVNKEDIDLDALEQKARAATPIPDAPGYAVDAEGRVWSIASNWRGYGARQLRAVPNTSGYLRVRLPLTTGRRTAFVHKLVASAFLPPRPSSQHEIRHLDGNRTNNAATNLAWGTRKENAADRDAHGTTARGDRNGMRTRPEARLVGARNPNAKLTDAQVKEIRDRYVRIHRRKSNASDLAAEYGVCSALVISIANGKYRSHAG